GDEQNEGLRADFAKTLQQLQAVEPRHLHVAQGHIERPLGGPGQSLLAVGAGGDGEALLRQILGERLANERRLVPDQDVGLADGRRQGRLSARRGCGTGHRITSHSSDAGRLTGSFTGSAAGRRTQNIVPSPGRDSKVTVPPWSLTNLCVTNS